MRTQQQDTELREAVEVTRNEYIELAEQHEWLVANAQCAASGSAAMLQRLLLANELGPRVSIALRRYLDAVEILTVFYENFPSICENDPDADKAISAIAARAHVATAMLPLLRRVD